MIKDTQDGRSMLEMLGVLSIVGVLTVGGFGLVNKVSNSNQANNVIDEISGLASKVRIVARDYYSCFSDDKNETETETETENVEACGSFMSYISKAKAYPDTLECEGEECSEFLGSADVTYTVSSATYPELFSITVNNLTDEMCMNLVTANWGSASTTGFMGIDGTDGGRNFSACNGNNDSGSLTLRFR